MTRRQATKARLEREAEANFAFYDDGLNDDDPGLTEREFNVRSDGHDDDPLRGIDREEGQ